MKRTFNMLLPWLLMAAGAVLILIALPWQIGLFLIGLLLVLFGILRIV